MPLMLLRAGIGSEKPKEINRNKAGRGGCKGKGKNKMGYAQKSSILLLKPKTLTTRRLTKAKDAICTTCVMVGTGEGNYRVFTEVDEKEEAISGS
ncbi:hypothetical protein Tco_0636943 [Tanacetum coccineum]